MMHTDITLTLPCPICPSPGQMLTAIYEPALGGDTPLVAEVSGCKHVDGIRLERLSEALWRSLHHEAEMYLLDQYSDALEQKRPLREED